MEASPTDALPCKSTSPTRKLPCNKPDHHNRTERIVTHQNGRVTWNYLGRELVAPGLADEIRSAAKQTMSGEATTKINLGKPTYLTFTNSQTGEVIDLTNMVSNVRIGDEIDMTSFPPGTTESREDKMESPQEKLGTWWRHQAETEIERTVPKAIEYGATDLIDIGRNIARLSGRLVDDEQAAELGLFFYLEGKFARWRSAIIEGRKVSDDTLFDIGVYVRMAQRVRYAGGWPGVKLESE